MNIPDYQKTGLFVDGHVITSAFLPELDLCDPATGDIWATVSRADASALEEAIASSANAFSKKQWKEMSPPKRGSLLAELAALIRKDNLNIAALEARNTGKPLTNARSEVEQAARCFDFYARAITELTVTVQSVDTPGKCMIFREPVGVVVAIVPWNYPLLIAAWKIAPALAMGNTVLLKPASLTPLSAIRLAELASAAGFPDGVLNVIPCLGSDVGTLLLEHPQVRKISFTGSSSTGVDIYRLAALTLKRLTLELGGKSANIIFADADHGLAVPSAVRGILGNAGQDCCARSRLLIERSCYAHYIDMIATLFKARRLGPPFQAGTEMGPLISSVHREKVMRHVVSGIAQGAHLVCGGQPPPGDTFHRGFYWEPTLFAEVTSEMSIFQDEIFGPVLSVCPFDCEDEAIDLANKTIYGLSGSVWTADQDRAMRVARAVDSGVLSINSLASIHLAAPFGGFKFSGIGRELGLAALDTYSESKTVFIADLGS